MLHWFLSVYYFFCFNCREVNTRSIYKRFSSAPHITVVIAIDRYWLIALNMRYTHGTALPRRHACKLMGALAWALAGIISLSPLVVGWSPRVDPRSGACQISQDYAYTVISTFGAFWFPLFVILVVYCRIFWISQRRQVSGG